MTYATETIVTNRKGNKGTILNGFSMIKGEWSSYQVATDYGMEVWLTADIIAKGDKVRDDYGQIWTVLSIVGNMIEAYANGKLNAHLHITKCYKA